VFKKPIRAVLLDVDGTLYHQGALRLLMTSELCTLPFLRMSLGSACSTWRSLACFRLVREELRQVGKAESSLARRQYLEVARRTGEDPIAMERVVSEWFYERPLKYLRFCRRRGVDEFFSFLEAKNILAGVFSDYPVHHKLRALGLSNRVSLALCATDPEINAFKPNPKGFLHACRIWGLQPEKVLYVGDRPEIDATGAANAGMHCAILRRRTMIRNRHESRRACAIVSSFKELQDVVTANP